ncbi:hypothetical protein O181_100050 [Austropuccinia psidii MF-1]|uniref:Uncharacterized protein n=1 Tax=Austropuccinia psidii MF-1 TaxID=1389203 RepID=A0A9Q3JET7_9BASI|nr:hypothetical protein [Austropuccinia psidii MF-1]
MSTPLNQDEGTRNYNPQIFHVESSQLKNEFSTYLHNLIPSMVQELLKGVPKLKELAHFGGEGECDHIEFIRFIDMIEEALELPGILATERFNTLFTKSADRGYIKLSKHKDTTVELGGKPKFLINGPMMIGALRYKQLLNLANLILTKTKLYHGFSNKNTGQQYYIL